MWIGSLQSHHLEEQAGVAALFTNGKYLSSITSSQARSTLSSKRKMAAKRAIPEKQWAQVFEKCRGPLEYKQIPVPKPKSDEVLVKIKFSGVCHTDLHVRIHVFWNISLLIEVLIFSVIRLGRATGPSAWRRPWLAVTKVCSLSQRFPDNINADLLFRCGSSCEGKYSQVVQEIENWERHTDQSIERWIGKGYWDWRYRGYKVAQ